MTSHDTTSAPTTATEVAPTARRARGVKSFADVGVHPVLVDALEAKGFAAPFPIQELTLPIATKGHDVIGQARTGTGKTLAFGLALLGRITPGEGTQALVIVPTRELCLQVADELQIGRGRDLRVIAVYGGVGYEEQEAAFRGGHEVVVGTPGRLLDHLNKGNLRLGGVTELVLDEADEMLDMGFLPDVERLIEACSDDRHSMLFSATMPTEVVKLARRYLDQPTFMRADTEPHETAPNVEQHFFQVHRMDKPRVLARILQTPNRGGVYVFVRTKHMADRLVRELEDLGTPAIAIHGDLRQSTREKNLDRFRDGSATVLVATEVAARGLDVENVTHVVNYDCPDDEKMYLHRIGRTARAGAKGVAITFAEFNEADRLNVIRKKLGATDTDVEAVFSTSEELTKRFDLPAERPWDAHVEAAKAGSRTDRREDDGARRRDDGDRRGKRTGRSDGRPKSKRSAEGTGSDRDADRARRDRSRGRDGADRRTDDGRGDGRSRGTAAEQPTTNAPDTTGEDRRDAQGGGTPRSGDGDGARQGRERTRTRTRARSSDAGSSAPRSRETPSDDDRSDDRGGERPRARTRASEPSSRSRDDRRGGRDGDSRPRARRDRDGGGSARERDQRDGARGGDASRSRGGGSSRDGSRGPDGGGGRNGGGDREGGRDRGGRERKGGGRRGRQRGGESASRNGRGDSAVPVARRGEEARGQGAPQLARRVKVEHLP
jgi:superfamily II DNA/RNA helicase